MLFRRIKLSRRSFLVLPERAESDLIENNGNRSCCFQRELSLILVLRRKKYPPNYFEHKFSKTTCFFLREKNPKRQQGRRYPDALIRKDTNFLNEMGDIDSRTSNTFHKYLDGKISKHDSNSREY